MFASLPFRFARLGAAFAVAAIAVVLVGLLTVRGDEAAHPLILHWGLFYGVTAGAYAALPFIRRDDIVTAMSWLVLAAGIAPCIQGHEISAANMFSDMGGVATVALPIYIARLRQVTQGDTRPERRRQFDRAEATTRPADRSFSPSH